MIMFLIYHLIPDYHSSTPSTTHQSHKQPILTTWTSMRYDIPPERYHNDALSFITNFFHITWIICMITMRTIWWCRLSNRWVWAPKQRRCRIYGVFWICRWCLFERKRSSFTLSTLVVNCTIFLSDSFINSFVRFRPSFHRFIPIST
jgi:hypothetical protein